jgi:hypothetical protein
MWTAAVALGHPEQLPVVTNDADFDLIATEFPS